MYNHQLDTFIQVAEVGSFSKAAAALYITPTAVIKQMNLLEATVGVPLFVRTHRGLTLTAAGSPSTPTPATWSNTPKRVWSGPGRPTHPSSGSSGWAAHP